ncbi:hypothetical protein LHJ74_14400 [Streptomyces sp. N2-109]|uniref:Uncharacterized protein n=1 Tax=Streptomyces gossypii TaxID=2883101 RepID=A0ABT2JUW6_9ACTN|nr:hypothetical protein [Streptomyces gossypii]MCT2591084.1 hypothetical protein [Streptomyces gossypii]
MKDASQPASARFVLSDDLPDGVPVLLIESPDGTWTWLIRRGHMEEEAVTEVNRLLGHVTGNGLWVCREAAAEQYPRAS